MDTAGVEAGQRGWDLHRTGQGPSIREYCGHSLKEGQPSVLTEVSGVIHRNVITGHIGNYVSIFIRNCHVLFREAVSLSLTKGKTCKFQLFCILVIT